MSKIIKKFKVKGMDCASCATIIELDLEEKGFKAKCNFAKEELVVEFDDPEDEKKITTIVQNSGYSIEEK